MYHIIRKVHCVNGELEYTPIGYVLTHEDSLYIDDDDSKNKATQWVMDNIVDIRTGIIPISDYFIDNPPFYVEGYMTTDVSGMGLSEIVDLDNPDGV